MSKYWSVLAIALAISLFSCGPANAKGKKAPVPPEQIFKTLDTNADGFLSLEEWLAGPLGQKDPEKAKAAYKTMDTKGDGKVTLEEFKAFKAKMKAAHEAATKGAGGGGQ